MVHECGPCNCVSHRPPFFKIVCLGCGGSPWTSYAGSEESIAKVMGRGLFSLYLLSVPWWWHKQRVNWDTTEFTHFQFTSRCAWTRSLDFNHALWSLQKPFKGLCLNGFWKPCSSQTSQTMTWSAKWEGLWRLVVHKPHEPSQTFIFQTMPTPNPSIHAKEYARGNRELQLFIF